ncbi:MAG: helix-turn-helix domain-containing protein [Candidatus Woesearchaeota archaeon]
MACEMCGARDVPLKKTLIEGVELHVCAKCRPFGKALEPKKVVKTFVKKQVVIADIKKDYAHLLKQKREQKGMRQVDLAKFLNEKESLIHQIESGHLKPSDGFIKKVRSMLGLELLDTSSDVQPVEVEQTSRGAFTIGDLLKKT